MAITPFKVIQIADFGTNRKLIYDFLLVINTNITYYIAPFSSYGWLLVKLLLARAQCLTLSLSLGWTLPISP